jgi:hypothetical protein
MTLSARSAEKVEYRPRDGAGIAIRPGTGEVAVSGRDLGMRCSEGDWHGASASWMAIGRRHLSSKALQTVDMPRS